MEIKFSEIKLYSQWMYRSNPSKTLRISFKQQSILPQSIATHSQRMLLLKTHILDFSHKSKNSGGTSDPFSPVLRNPLFSLMCCKWITTYWLGLF